MITHRIVLPLLLCFFSPLVNADSPTPRPPEAWNEWANWAEKLRPVTDAQGHGPDVGSDEWSGALSRQLGIEDKDGHGPDYRSKEWRAAVEAKLTKKAAKPNIQRQLLSSHKTVARFKGFRKHRCMGRTALCPDRCGHSGRLATFEILKYLDYRKPGKYGDPRQKEFQILIDNSLNKDLIEEPVRGLMLDLKAGDLVKLSWRHDYVTKEGSKFPERVIVDLESITKQQADSLMSP